MLGSFDENALESIENWLGDVINRSGLVETWVAPFGWNVSRRNSVRSTLEYVEISLELAENRSRSHEKG